MTAYHGRAPIVRAGMSCATGIVLALIVAVVGAFVLEVALLLPYLNRQ